MASSLILANGAAPKVLCHGRTEEEEAFSHAMCLVTSSAVPVCLKTALDLEVFDIIAKAGEGAKLSSEELVAQMPTDNPDAATTIDRILRLLASHSVLSCSVVSDENGSNVKRLYGLSPVSRYFVTNEDGISLGHFIAMVQDKVFVDTWTQIKASILEGGIAFNRSHGMHAFEYLGRDLRLNNVFNKAMHSHSTIVMKAILAHYEGFENIKQLVDVGGGLGMTLNQITSKYPHIAGINFDLSHVVERAPFYPGLEHVGGDMFESVPDGDAIFMKWILHDWPDEPCLKLLKNCYKAIPDNGKVIVVEATLPVTPETNFAAKSVLASDMGMLLSHPGGKERSQQEFLALATSAGFSGIKFVCCVYTYWVMELYK